MQSESHRYGDPISASPNVPIEDLGPLSVKREVCELRSMLHHESPRGCVTVGAVYLEAKLEELLCANFVPGRESKQVAERFSFKQSVDLAYAMGLISKHAYNELEMIRKVRNKFAHNLAIGSFDEADISKLCHELGMTFPETVDQPRQLFVKSVFVVAAELHCATKQAQPKASPHNFDDSELMERVIEQMGEYIVDEDDMSPQ